VNLLAVESTCPLPFSSLLAARKLWATYSQDVDAVVYLVDASDIERFPESKKELDVSLSPSNAKGRRIAAASRAASGAGARGSATVFDLLWSRQAGHMCFVSAVLWSPGDMAFLSLFYVHPARSPLLPRRPSRPQALLASEKLLNTPFLILGNKIDLATAVSEEQLKMQLGLTGATTGKETTALPKDMRPIEVYMCSIMRKTGYGEGLKWLTNFV